MYITGSLRNFITRGKPQTFLPTCSKLLQKRFVRELSWKTVWPMKIWPSYSIVPWEINSANMQISILTSDIQVTCNWFVRLLSHKLLGFLYLTWNIEQLEITAILFLINDTSTILFYYIAICYTDLILILFYKQDLKSMRYVVQSHVQVLK